MIDSWKNLGSIRQDMDEEGPAYLEDGTIIW